MFISLSITCFLTSIHKESSNKILKYYDHYFKHLQFMKKNFMIFSFKAKFRTQKSEFIKYFMAAGCIFMARDSFQNLLSQLETVSCLMKSLLIWMPNFSLIKAGPKLNILVFKMLMRMNILGSKIYK